MRGSRKIVREGPTLITVFLVDVGRKDPNTIISRPSSARQRNTINVDDGPTFNAGLVALSFFRRSRPVLLRKSIFLLFFREETNPRGGGGYSIFSAYVGSDPASTVHPKNIRNLKHPQKIFEIFATPKNIPILNIFILR